MSVPAVAAAAGIVLLALAAALARGTLWGAHTLAYVPWPLGLLLVMSAIAACAWLAGGAGRHLSRHVPAATPTGLLSVGVLSALTFWVFRVRHLLLGDGLPMVASAGGEFRLHPLEPVASLIQHVWVRTFAPIFLAAGHHEFYATWYSMALGSCLIGGAFVVTAYGVARELECQGAPGSMAPASPTTATWVVTALLVLQGYALLFFGYVEHYGILLLAMMVYICTALRVLRGRGRFAVSAVALAFAVSVHLSALALLPSFLALSMGSGRRLASRRAVVGLLTLLLAGLALTAAFAQLDPEYFFPTAIWNLLTGLVAERGGELPNPIALANVILLAGPIGFILFMASVIRTATAHGARQHWGFAAMLGCGALVALLIAGPSNLGYARNWDLLAPTGLLFLTSGLMLLRLAGQPATSSQWAVAMLLISAVHVIPWVALNADEEVSIRRMSELPLGGGRAESTIGYWRMLRGRPADARRWFERAVEGSPNNVRARLFLGDLLIETGDLRGAEEHLRAARALRPDLATAGVLLANALWLSGQEVEARRELEDTAGDATLTPSARAELEALTEALAMTPGGARQAESLDRGRWTRLLAMLREGVMQ